jgi:hypothetical protein
VSFAAITLCVASQRVFIAVCLFRYGLSPETFGYTPEQLHVFIFLHPSLKVPFGLSHIQFSEQDLEMTQAGEVACARACVQSLLRN